MKKRKTTKEELILQVPQFLLDKIEIIEVYKGGKVLVEDKYGRGLTTIHSLRRGHSPSIKTAINKTEYFLNELSESNKHYINGEFEVLGEYKGVHNKILCRNKYGEALMNVSTLLTGSNVSVKSAVNRRDYQINQFKEVHGDTYEYLDSFYTSDNRKEYYNVKCKCGNISPITFDNILLGKGCNKCWVEKNKSFFSKYKTEEEFIQACSHLRGVDLTNCGYKYLHDKIDILCTIHNHKYKQIASSTLKGAVGCPYCKKGVNTLFDKDFIERGRGRNANLYLLEFKDEQTNESFLKVGRTYQEVRNRFGLGNNFKIPYKLVDIVSEVNSSPENIVDYENEVLYKFKRFKYSPNKFFNGHTECFSLDALEGLKTHFQGHTECYNIKGGR